MEDHRLTEERIEAFGIMLKEEEHSRGTIEKYVRDLKSLASYLADRAITKERIAEWKQDLLHEGYAPVTVNSMLSAVHRFSRFMGWEDCRVRFLCIQRRTFRDQCKELTQGEYQRLLTEAQRLGYKRLKLLLETICATGIRVSEVRAITLEAVQRGYAEIRLKGKIRTILLPGRLRKKIVRYAKKKNICSGEIFRNKGGKGLSRQQIWREMKHLARKAGVEESKVFPHNLRHLFAQRFYQVSQDIVQLADLLGHSSINTTRIYLMTTGEDHLRRLEQLGLVT